MCLADRDLREALFLSTTRGRSLPTVASSVTGARSRDDLDPSCPISPTHLRGPTVDWTNMTTPVVAFPEPLHILSDGDPLHSMVHARLGSLVTITTSKPESSPAVRRGDGAHVMRRLRRQRNLDGITGAVRAGAARGRLATKVLRAIVANHRNNARIVAADERYAESVGNTLAAAGSPDHAGTIVAFGPREAGETRIQELRIHLGWPSHPGRAGVIAALTHRDITSVCAVVEAIGPISGWATAWPPLCEDDDAESIQRRVAACGADLAARVVEDPAMLRRATPEFGVVSQVVDAVAVSNDVRSKRLFELIRSAGRF